MRKILSALVRILLALTLCGCDFLSIDPEALLDAPKIADEQTAIYQALVAYVGKNVTLKYPRSGDYTSAFVIADIDSESGDEALVFYTRESDENVYVCVLDKADDGSWQGIFQIEGMGDSIDKVAINSIGNVSDIIVGFGTAGYEDSVVCIYRYYGSSLAPLYENTYSVLEITDLDDCGYDEVICVGKSGDRLQVTVIKSSDGLSYLMYEAPLSSSVAAISGYTYGTLTDGGKIFYLDVMDDSGYITTEMVYFTEDGLVCPTSSISGLRELTKRQYSYGSIDYDDDGVVEIPVNEQFIGYSNGNLSGNQVMTVWYAFDTATLSYTKGASTYYNVKEEYVFRIPNRWLGIVTPIADEETGFISFAKYDSKAESADELEKLMTIASYDINEDDGELIADGYELILKTDYRKYYVKTLADSAQPLVLTSDEIANNFYAVSDNS